MKTKILFCISDFKQGGIPRCLQSLLMNIDATKYSVDLICLSQDGPYKGKIPNCRVLKEDYVVSQLMVHTKKVKNWMSFLPAFALKVLRTAVLKMTKKDLLFERLNTLGRRCGHYDVAIAYAEGFPAKVVEQVDATKKLVWIHNDYAFEGAIGGGGKITDFQLFNKICCVSKATELSFQKAYPKWADKTTTLYNLINEDYICRQSLLPLQDDKFNTDSFTIISIGRVCAQKQFHVIPRIAAALKAGGVDFHWYIVGGGPENEVALVRQNIEREQVADKVILLGERDNPYQYLKRADLFVLTSLYESYPTVINEARVLQVPIVANSIPPVYEMLDEEEAMIVSNDDMAEAIKDLIKDKEHYNALKSKHYVNKNREIMDAFYTMADC